ncbi:uncharacterized protein LOC111116026 [Crassostrea virginica]|uniref:Uncharacterized protein LOC111110806 n=1 Tax=Crassostrea virginica TaxID=6565 RepID=A0A8B8BIE0_CRAVI|nr:uncharacterized protein LOC111110806 [Crassostrea virginica]XP_022310699.1 uncharacterized protein LOC111116026 [Crassostrea virginica]
MYAAIFISCFSLMGVNALSIQKRSCSVSIDSDFAVNKFLGDWYMAKRKPTGARKISVDKYAWHVTKGEGNILNVRQTGRLTIEGVYRPCFNKSATLTPGEISGEFTWKSDTAVSKADIEIIKVEEGLAFVNMCVPNKKQGKCGSFVLAKDDNPSEQEVNAIDAGINTELCEDSTKFENLIKPDVEICP